MAHRSLAAVLLLASLFLAATAFSVEAYTTDPLLHGMPLMSRCCLKSAVNYGVLSYLAEAGGSILLGSNLQALGPAYHAVLPCQQQAKAACSPLT